MYILTQQLLPSRLRTVIDGWLQYKNLKALKYLIVSDYSINYNKYIQFNSLQQVT